MIEQVLFAVAGCLFFFGPSFFPGFCSADQAFSVFFLVLWILAFRLALVRQSFFTIPSASCLANDDGKRLVR